MIWYLYNEWVFTTCLFTFYLQLCIVLHVCLTYIVHYVLSCTCTNIIIASILSIPTGALPCSLGSFHTFNIIGALQHDVTTRFFTNQCHLNPFDMSACDPRSCELQTKQGGFKTGEFPSILPSCNGNSQTELKEFIAKRRSFGGTRCIWCKAPIWGLPILLTVDGPGSTKQYQSWVYIAVFWVSSTQTHRQIRQDLYECAWCFMWGLANTFFCLEALIYKKHRKTSKNIPALRVRTLNIKSQKLCLFPHCMTGRMPFDCSLADL